MRPAGVLILLGLSAAPLRPGVAQDSVLTLSAAIGRAHLAHPGLIEPRAEQARAEAFARGARAAYLPQLSVQWSLVRTNDPVAVFGNKLRQAGFSESDLALEALNRPAPITNSSLGLTIGQPLFVPEAWLGRKAALAAAESARRREERAEELSGFDVVQAYFVAQLMGERLRTLDTLIAAGQRTLHQVQTLRREGMVTAVDEQLALARVSELEAARAEADGERIVATDRLLTLIGEEPGRPVLLVEPLESPRPELATSEERADLAAMEAALRAADANLTRAKSQWLPSLSTFGSLDWNQGRAAAFAGPHRWTVGVSLQWRLFRGLADVADLQAARAERQAVAERTEAIRRDAEAEVRAAEARVMASRAAVEAADRALEHAIQAVRIAESRYSGGIATITELLAVRAAEASHRLGRLESLYRLRVAEAALRLAHGGMPE